MRLLKIFLLLLAPAILLSSCFWESKDEDKTASDSVEIVGDENGIPSPKVLEYINKNTEERQRVQSLSVLNSENLATQTDTIEGKKVLKDRHLFVNYVLSAKADSVTQFMKALEEVQLFAKTEGVELTREDINVIITAAIGGVDANICKDFNATKKNLDTNSSFYRPINSTCNPIPS